MKYIFIFQLDAYNRVIVGGSSHTVSMGGYTLGGGHSPMGRMFGLSVDNLLEAELVSADGKIVVASKTSTRITESDGTEVHVAMAIYSGLYAEVVVALWA